MLEVIRMVDQEALIATLAIRHATAASQCTMNRLPDAHPSLQYSLQETRYINDV